MPIENILTKIIVNTNKLPYEKQKLLLQITEEWLSEISLGEQNAASSINIAHSGTLKSTTSAISSSQLDDSLSKPESIITQPEYNNNLESIEHQSQAIHFVESLHETSNKDDVVVNIIEERAHQRKDMSIPIDFVSAGQLYKEVTKDLSAGGLFIRTKKHTKFKKNQKISMVFELSPDKKPFKLTGKIIRIESEGIAVQFHNISPFECVAIEEELANPSE